eukprot:g17090.t1
MFLRISVTLATWALVDAVRDEIFQVGLDQTLEGRRAARSTERKGGEHGEKAEHGEHLTEHSATEEAKPNSTNGTSSEEEKNVGGKEAFQKASENSKQIEEKVGEVKAATDHATEPGQTFTGGGAPPSNQLHLLHAMAKSTEVDKDFSKYDQRLKKLDETLDVVSQKSYRWQEDAGALGGWASGGGKKEILRCSGDILRGPELLKSLAESEGEKYSPLANAQAAMRHAKEGNTTAPGDASQEKEQKPPESPKLMSAGLIGFGAGLKNMVDGPVQKSDSGAAPRKRFSIVKAEVEEARESRSLHSLAFATFWRAALMRWALAVVLLGTACSVRELLENDGDRASSFLQIAGDEVTTSVLNAEEERRPQRRDTPRSGRFFQKPPPTSEGAAKPDNEEKEDPVDGVDREKDVYAKAQADQEMISGAIDEFGSATSRAEKKAKRVDDKLAHYNTRIGELRDRLDQLSAVAKRYHMQTMQWFKDVESDRYSPIANMPLDTFKISHDKDLSCRSADRFRR